MRKIKTYLHSFSFKIVFSAILFLIPAIALPSLWISHIHTQDLMTLDEKQTAASFEIAKTNLQSLLDDASNAVNVVQTNKAVEDYLLGEFSSAAGKALAKRDFDSTIKSVLLMYPYITDILFLKEDNTLVGSSQEWHYTDEPSDHPLLQTENFRSSLNSTKLQWFDSFDIQYLTQALNVVKDGSFYPSGHRICGLSRLRYTYSGSVLDRNIIVLVAIDELDVRQRFAHLISGEGDLSILSSSGKYISSADESMLDQYADFFSLIPPKSAFGSFSFKEESGAESRIIYSRMDSTDWLLIRSVPIDSYSISEKRLQKTTLKVGLVFLSIISVLYIGWVKRLCRPLHKMTETLLAVSEGNLDIRLPDAPSAPIEIRLMTEQMNAMLESLNELILQNKESEQRKYVLEMRSLQAQITPHFLFNTLTSIRWLASMKGADDVACMLTSFARLLRPVFGDWTMEWSLQEELSFARNYIDLIHMRFENRVIISIDCPDNLLTHLVPRFTLQPLLENCCEHGLHDGQILAIDVKVYENDEALAIVVQDNGSGMPPETLRQLRENLQKDDDPEPGANGHRSIGLYNIHKRLTLYYNESSGLRVDSTPGEGTKVTVLITKNE